MAEISKIPVSDFDAAVRLLSGGTNVAIYNEQGMPSIYVRRDKGLISDVIDGGSNDVHYAFKVNGVEIPAFYMGKYLATVYNGRALSLPLQHPTTNKLTSGGTTPVNFQNAKRWCEDNGSGFHLPTIAEYAWIALLCKKNDTMPSGNTNYGKNGSASYLHGVGSIIDEEGRVCSTLTGSGPAYWNDTLNPDGICDLAGNVCEWQGGYRTVNGEIQIFADNDAAMKYDQMDGSTLWKAILRDGSLVAPGAPNTLKWDYTQDPGNDATTFRLNTTLEFKQTSDTAYGAICFAKLKTAGFSVSERLKALALMPEVEDAFFPHEFVYMRNLGTRYSYRGGSWSNGLDAGVFNVNGCSKATNYYPYVGFRPAFIPGI